MAITWPGRSAELGWLGHFAKKSARLEEFHISGHAFENCSKQSVNEFMEDIVEDAVISKGSISPLEMI